MIDDGFFRKDLPGGAHLVGETVPGRSSVSIGVWLRVGSRDEEPGREGLVHLIEHLVFKGTHRRTAKEIAASLEQGGGSLEAFTTKDATCFYARVLADQTELAVDVLGDLVSHPRFLPEDLERERQVVIEEIRNVRDAPEDLIGDLAAYHLWPGDIMGASILGTQASLEQIEPATVTDFHAREYHSPRVVVSAAGAVDPDRLEELVRQHLELPPDPPPERRRAPRAATSTLALHRSDLSQLHLTFVAEAPAEKDPRRRPVQLLAEIVGGGMSSRLFQRIREEAGLAYSVGAYTEHYEDVGLFGTSLAVSPERGQEAVSSTLAEMDRLVRDGLEPGELEGAKAQVRASLMMGLESLTNRMSYLARAEFRTGGREPVDQVVAEFEAVTEAEVQAAAEAVLAPGTQTLVALGPSRVRDLNSNHFKQILEVEEG